MAKVLLVEDDNNLREIYEARLQAEGYETATASDGEQALVVAKEAKPDLVISDVMMPKISGFEMLDILRNTDGLKDVKVIMLTALGQAEDKTRADQLGADKYLVKSQVTLEDIVKTAHQLLDEGPASVPAAPAPAAPAAAAPTAAPVEPAAVPAEPVSAPTVDSTAATAADEAQAMQAQINDFVAQPSVNPPAADPEPAAAPANEPVAPAPVAAPTAAPVEPAAAPAEPASAPDDSATTHDDQVMASAVDALSGTTDAQKPSDVTAVEIAPPADNTATPETAPAPAEPAPEETAEDSDDGVTPSHKKVIRPITDSTNAKPDINQLLAAEEAANAAAQAPAVATPPPNITEPPVDPNKPNPNEIAL